MIEKIMIGTLVVGCVGYIAAAIGVIVWTTREDRQAEREALERRWRP